MQQISSIPSAGCRAIASLGVVLWGIQADGAAYAGMPSVRLSDAASLRFQTISFFLVVLIICSIVVKWIWNAVVSENSSLPRLTFRRSLGIVVLWGLLFVIVLTMISGARELMTPGAWKRKGFTYELRDQSPAPSTATSVDSEQVREREAALRELGAFLVASARANKGRFPDSEADSLAPTEAWLVPGTNDLKYVYVGKRKALRDPTVVVAYEPAVFSDATFELLADGTVKRKVDR